ncbi:hypothetical protein C8Q73DRAFT_643673 [Cubamyces lactineus]|nr:hypothetical protein C8Q73DRAFT_643673 [Cubamyces lactineus]
MPFVQFAEDQIIILASETGSGKTTVSAPPPSDGIPHFVCYADLPHTTGKMVACTQPRRVSTMSVAKRGVADEKDGKFPSDCA